MNHCQCLFCSTRRFFLRVFKIGRAGKVSAQSKDIQPRDPVDGYDGMEP